MFRRSALTSSIAHCRPSKIVAPQIAFVSCQSSLHTSAIVQKSATEVVKENLEKLNRKIGKAAAEGIEKTQEASHSAHDVMSETAHKASSILGHAEEKANQASADVNDTAEKAKDHAQDKAEKVKDHAQDKAEKAKDFAQDKTHELKKKAGEFSQK